MFAALASIGGMGLFWSHRGFYEKAHDDEDDDDEDHSEDEEEEANGETSTR